MRVIFRSFLLTSALLTVFAGALSALTWYPSAEDPYRVMQAAPRETGWESAGNETFRNLRQGVATAVAWMSFTPTPTPTPTATPSATPTATPTVTPTQTPTGTFAEYLRSDVDDVAWGDSYLFAHDVSVSGDLTAFGAVVAQVAGNPRLMVTSGGDLQVGNTTETGDLVRVLSSVRSFSVANDLNVAATFFMRSGGKNTFTVTGFGDVEVGNDSLSGLTWTFASSVEKVVSDQVSRWSLFGGGYANVSVASGAVISLHPTVANTAMAFAYGVPNLVMGGAVEVTGLTVEYETTAAAAYLDRVYLRTQDGSALTTQVDYTTDLGNGTTGPGSQEIVSTPFALDDAWLQIEVVPAGQSAADEVRIRRFVLTFHTL